VYEHVPQAFSVLPEPFSKSPAPLRISIEPFDMLVEELVQPLFRFDSLWNEYKVKTIHFSPVLVHGAEL